jgi:hypothetical protein
MLAGRANCKGREERMASVFPLRAQPEIFWKQGNAAYHAVRNTILVMALVTPTPTYPPVRPDTCPSRSAWFVEPCVHTLSKQSE